jgi:cytochrome c oxidase subunit 2
VSLAGWNISTLSAEHVAQETSLGLPADVSLEGHRIDTLLLATHWMVGVLGIVALVWLFWSIARHRGNRPARYTRGTSRRAAAVPLGFGALMLVGVDGYLAWRSHHDLEVLELSADIERDPAAVRVQIGARQWAWDFRLPGSDGRFDTADDIYSVSELVVPVGQPVIYELASGDVVHSLYVPNLRVKRDAIPGSVNRGWFQVERAGRYEIACAQHCGVHHYKMRAVIRALAPQDFRSWVDIASADGRAVAAEEERAREASPSLQDRSPFAEPLPGRGWTWAWQGEMP